MIQSKYKKMILASMEGALKNFLKLKFFEILDDFLYCIVNQ